MTSRFKVLEKARLILHRHEFCLYHDPRFTIKGIARQADGNVTSPENKPAVMFTLTGAVCRAIYDMTKRRWVDEYNVYSAAMRPLYDRVCLDHYQFLIMCDKLGKAKCLALLDEVIEV